MQLFLSPDNVRLSGKLNDINDSVAGGCVAGGTGFPLYGGLLGARMALSAAEALALSDTAVGTLYGGIYQYVRFLTGATQAPARGNVAFWGTTQSGASPFANDGTQFIVTTDGSATVGDGLWAGIILNAVTKGNYGWIQIAGLASASFKATPTSNLIGNLVVVTGGTFTVDALADATAVTDGVAKRILGVCAEAPGTSGSVAIARIFLKNPFLVL